MPQDVVIAMSLFAGRLRGGNEFGYQTVHLLKNETVGVGSYGSVFHARLDQLVCAAKALHPALLHGDRFDPASTHIVDRFHSECELLSRLRHPNIVQYLGTATDPVTQQPVLFMELLDCSLTHFLEEETKPLPYRLQINFAHDIAVAISFLHHNGIIHRDLSGNNVLLLAGVRAKVTDFGMSTLFDNATRRSALTQCPGNFSYMPPEALKNPPVYNERLDVFSMGVLFIQIMTRLFPNPSDRYRHCDRFPGERTVMIAVSEIERREEHISKINRTHPLLQLALQCLKNESHQRPTTQEICHSIEELKASPAYQENEQQTRQRIRLEQQNSHTELRELNDDLLQQLEEKEAVNEGQQQEIQHLMDQLHQNTGELRNTQPQLPQFQPHNLPGMGMEDVRTLRQQLSASREANLRLQDRVRELECRAEQLQEQQRLAPTLPPPPSTCISYRSMSYLGSRWAVQCSAVYTVLYQEYTERVERSVWSFTSMTTGLRKLISDMFEAPFTTSSVCVNFDPYNTLTIRISEDDI